MNIAANAQELILQMKKKLIEVALPLEAINMESAREKSIRHGHPSTLHLWWARRPLAACRAVLWASLVDDPSSWPDKFPTEEDQKQERQRLFDILGRITIETDKKGNTKQVVRGLVSWDDVNDPKSKVLEAGQREIARCLAWDRGEEPPTKPDAVREYIAKYAPPAYDPFAGGGSIPLEAQRLGLEAHASDLNPVAVLINKALIEIPPKFKDQPPVNPEDRQKKGMSSWKGAQGLAADVRYYGQWMRDEAFKQIGHLYPKVKLPKEYGGGEATVIAWLWARTVKCPNPACGCQMPLIRSFHLATKKGKEAWIEPIVNKAKKHITFQVAHGQGGPPEAPKIGRGATFRCLVCSQPADEAKIREEFQQKNNSQQMMVVVTEGSKGRIYLPANEEYIKIAEMASPRWVPEEEMNQDTSNLVSGRGYGIDYWHEIFTKRQLLLLSTLSDLIAEVIDQAKSAIKKAKNNQDIYSGYAEAIATYLAFAIDRLANYSTTICTWHSGVKYETLTSSFGRQALPMTWDFAEGNPFSNSTGNFLSQVDGIAANIDNLAITKTPAGSASQKDAATAYNISNVIFSTDPPYYDNIGYADLSDFFYIWLRHSLNTAYPDIFRTLLVPKSQELIAAPHRFNGDKQKAEKFFEEGLGSAFSEMRASHNPSYPLTVFYAFKQSETEIESSNQATGTASTGWETMLEGLLKSDFSITGTWPARTELTGNLKKNIGALASSIILVCRPRSTDAAKITRRQFLTELKRELPRALKTLQQGNVAPVDLAQASIGPGMAIFSQYAAVLENDGSPMRVRTALQLINQILDEFLTEQEGEFDGDTRWALTWFEQYQFEPGQYGDAETLSKAKNTSVQGMVDAGILEAKGGKVRLLKRSELKSDWNPNSDSRMPDWEIAQYLIHELDQKGEMGAAELLAKLGNRGEIARDLAYRLYSLCDRKGWAQEGIAYNSLVISWPEITRLASEFTQSQPVQSSLF